MVWMPRSCAVTLAGLALWAVFAVFATDAFAEHVRCGDLITHDTTLDSDLIDCPVEGVRIGASNVTLDLNGHTIDGSPEAESGVLALGFPTGVTVRGGTVQDFDYGIQLGWTDGLVEDIVALNNRDGGIRLSGWRHRVRRSAAVGNPSGIWVDGGYDMAISDNVSVRNGVGIAVREANRTTVVRNALRDNFAAGIYVYSSWGNRVERNNLNGDRFGLLLQSPIDEDSPGPNDFIRNRITGAVVDGIQIESVWGLTHLTGNVVTRSGDDGIQIGDVPAVVTDRSSVLAQNTTRHNADLGIEALPGVIDGGRNRAFRNGNPLQCLVVVCR
jgi:parallel beta-helix repeat protein